MCRFGVFVLASLCFEARLCGCTQCFRFYFGESDKLKHLQSTRYTAPTCLAGILRELVTTPTPRDYIFAISHAVAALNIAVDSP
jgi:hypothetical protein